MGDVSGGMPLNGCRQVIGNKWLAECHGVVLKYKSALHKNFHKHSLPLINHVQELSGNLVIDAMMEK